MRVRVIPRLRHRDAKLLQDILAVDEYVEVLRLGQRVIPPLYWNGMSAPGRNRVAHSFIIRELR